MKATDIIAIIVLSLVAVCFLVPPILTWKINKLVDEYERLTKED